MAARVMEISEYTKDGSGFKNLFKDIEPIDDLNLGLIIIMFIVSSLLYLLLTMYFEVILPSEFGVRKPWYFLCQVKIYKKDRKSFEILKKFCTKEVENNVKHHNF